MTKKSDENEPTKTEEQDYETPISALRIAQGVLGSTGGSIEFDGVFGPKVGCTFPMDAWVLMLGLEKHSGQERQTVVRLLVDVGLETVMAEMNADQRRRILKAGNRELQPAIRRHSIHKVNA